MTTEAPKAADSTAVAPTSTAIIGAPEAEAPKTAEELAQEAEADAAFGAGYNEVHGEATPRAVSRPADEPAKDPKPKAAASNDKPAPAAAPAPVVVKEEPVVYAKAGDVEDLKKQIAANHDKVFGTFGEIRAAIKASKDSPSGQPVKVTKEQLKRLEAEGFGELAEALAEDLNGLVLTAGSSFDQAAHDKAMDEKVATATDKLHRATEVKLLDVRHPDWRECFASEPFKVWRATLPAEAIQVLDHAWDSTALAGAMADFKEWRAKAETKAKADADVAAAKEAADAAARNQDKRLESAIAPQGGGQPSTSPSEDDAFEAGYKSVQTASG